MKKKIDRPYLWDLPTPPQKPPMVYGAIKVISRMCLGAAIAAVGILGGSLLYNNQTSYVERKGDIVRVVENYWPMSKITFTHLKDKGSTLRIEGSFSDDAVTFVDHDKDDSIDAMLVCNDGSCNIFGRGLPGTREYQLMEDATVTFRDIKRELGIDELLKKEFGAGYESVKVDDGMEYTL
ncbi:MAG: hypothetical protein V1729_06520 [Candidatus Woesearchaeota archaeon]